MATAQTISFRDPAARAALATPSPSSAPSNGEDLQDLHGDKLVLNMGPSHPSTHGVLRVIVELDGETVVKLQPVMGYLHRNHEKIGERNTYLMNMPFTDRLEIGRAHV